MIHVRHTSAAELARQRIRRALSCAPLVLLAGLAVACWSSSIRLISPRGQNDCNFHGVAFIPPESDAPQATAPALTPNQPEQEIPQPVLIAPIQPEVVLPELPLVMQEQVDEESTEISPFETTDLTLQQSETIPSPPAKAAVAAAPSPQEANTPETYTPPAYLHCPQPSYPPLLRQRRVQGMVGVRISVAADGTPSAVEITIPSGNATLDRHARSWILQHWRFAPAQRNGHPLAALVDTRINFVLNA